MPTIIVAPLKYIQGPNVLDSLGAYVKVWGSRWLVLSGGTGFRLKKDVIEKSFKEENCECFFIKFKGDSTEADIWQVAKRAKDENCDGIIGLGGGKVLDTARGAADSCNIPFVSVPTTASSDAPCASVSVIHNDDGSVAGARKVKSNPHLVVVDTKLISESPVAYLIAGMGDALATYYEALVCKREGHKSVAGGDVSESAMALARCCRDILIADGIKAKEDAEKKRYTPAIERVVEANIYLSGMGVESGGLSLAHAIQDALENILPETKGFLHGYRVGFGALSLVAHLNMEEEDLGKVLSFCFHAGLPVTFKDINITEQIEHKARMVAEAAVRTPVEVYRLPKRITAENVYDAMMEVDRLGRKIKSSERVICKAEDSSI